MCGIYGIWNRDGRSVDLGALCRATTMLRHRGPDDEGYLLVDTRAGRVVPCVGPDSMPGTGLPRIESYQGEPFDLAFGHRRLAIIDLSVAGHQPMSSPDGRQWLIYNGEVYNHKEIRRELRGRGYDFHSDTDSEVVVAAYQEWGPQCVTRFNGMWALAILDVAERMIFCSRDRFGIKPFHYSEIGGSIAFASEIKALVGLGDGIPFVPEPRAIARFIAMGAYPSARRGETFFGGVRALPPATNATISQSSREQARYFRIDVDNEQPGPEKEVIKEFKALLTDSGTYPTRSRCPGGLVLEWRARFLGNRRDH